ncbi:ataxin-7-like protein 3 isoform X2 [Danio aesculapii]|uniref:ataxin-7-like protein 3 isoform X2 n=1 Tax=Danio aesculapii TaxID=1142201 RepID=UPI0024C00EE6|nr:ataxin-7-like protein 3 isoform X2 [Danio aesculapii]
MKMEDMSLSGLDNTKLEALAHDVYSDLVEDACLGLCFEVHRAVKQGYFFLDETDQESMKDFEIVDQPGVDIFGQVYNQWKNKECVCPNCSRSIAASRFAPHLEKCLGMGRNSSRIANRRIASSNNTSKSESDQEDNDDINDNDWSYGSEKKAKKRKSEKNPNSPRRSKSLKHKNGELSGSVNPDMYKYNYSSGISYETLGPEELRSILTTQCGVVSEHTKKMCTRSTLPDSDTMLDNEAYEPPDGQLIMSRLHWDASSDISPSDSASSKASTNNSESKRPKKKKPSTLSLTPAGGAGERDKAQERERDRIAGGGSSGSSSQNALALSSRKKRPKLPVPPAPSIYDDLN